jgi:hypothetical protein
MTTTTENPAAKTKQVPDFYIFENGANNGQGGKPAGAAFAHKKGKGFTVVVAGKRYAAFPPKPKAAVQPEVTEGKGA